MPHTSDAAAPGHQPAQLKARTFNCMGTVISLTVPAKSLPIAPSPQRLGPGGQPADDELAAAAAVVERTFRELDQTFSLYRRGSEASALARGELALPDASAVTRDLFAEALEWRLNTEGAFTPERADGVLDLSGLVKGHAIREAATSLLALGLFDWCLNAGGDVLVSGSPRPGSDEAWHTGIVDPSDRTALLAGCDLGNGRRRHAALATSGSAERGDHIWSASASGPDFAQVSVLAEDIVTADVLATAIFAGGVPMMNRATEGWEIDVLAVRTDGQLLATPGFRAEAS
ncbi:thiamine biosynthesis lipoprotein [Arthrobacter sp. SLBN-100]|uniref:FAD:protein FMN transferase n=1 Tax=Arthrobacter sp. SLBN-100 TaxID=2768450 RepID=UPI00116CBE47|nr:thiamine biosynthesis lipoprotein [Arthrobacter sp. SLBN-100]